MALSPKRQVRKRQAFSDRFLRSLTPGPTPRDVSDLQQRGLIAWLLPSGTIQFVVRYRWQGKNRRLKLGTYSDQFTIAKARKAARAALVQVEAGHDPAGDRQVAKLAPTDTFGALAADYLKRHAKPNKRTAGEDERVLDVEILPKWKTRSVQALTRRDVRILVEAIVDRGSPVMANRVLALVRKVLNYAVDHDWIEANPAARMSKPHREVSRDRVLSDDEIRRLWRCLERQPERHERQAPGRRRATGTDDDPICPIGPALAAVQKVRLLTAQRGGEVVKMRWADLELPAEGAPAPRIGWWTIPGTDTKNGEPHRVPLTTRVVEIIEAQRKREDENELPGEPEHDRNGYVFIGSGASVRDRAKKAPARLSKVLGFEFRGHDLRRTAATNMAAAGVPRQHISAVLNHVEGGARATRVYDRFSYDGPKRAALEAWDRALGAILSQRPARVVPITKRA